MDWYFIIKCLALVVCGMIAGWWLHDIKTRLKNSYSKRSRKVDIMFDSEFSDFNGGAVDLRRLDSNNLVRIVEYVKGGLEEPSYCNGEIEFKDEMIIWRTT